MVTRILPEQEWPRLLETGCEVEQATREAAESGYVLVAENEHQEIVGTLFVTFSAHFDGAWVRQDCRDGSVLRRLSHQAMALARTQGVTKAFASLKNRRLSTWLQRRLKATKYQYVLFPLVTHGR